MKTAAAIIVFLFSSCLQAQTIGGRAAYNFLRLPTSPWQTASGAVNVSLTTNDVGFSFHNPALLSEQHHHQLSTSYNSFFSGINAYTLSSALFSTKLKTTLAAQIFFIDYGSIPLTDGAGIQSGQFRPVDFVVQLAGSRSYLEKWRFGITSKFIQSIYGQYRSAAVSFDVGILYVDSSTLFSAGLVAKNMGVQLANFAGAPEDLPFDLQIGLTKKLADAPLAFSITAQHVHRMNLNYQDAAFNNDNGFQSDNTGLNNLLNHFIAAAHIYLSSQLEATVGFNHLRRSELNTPNAENGLNGFSAGLRLKFQKLQVLYARSAYQKGIAYNHFGLNIELDKLGLGK